jgi:hypothetical protein
VIMDVAADVRPAVNHKNALPGIRERPRDHRPGQAGANNKKTIGYHSIYSNRSSENCRMCGVERPTVLKRGNTWATLAEPELTTDFTDFTDKGQEKLRMLRVALSPCDLSFRNLLSVKSVVKTISTTPQPFSGKLRT